MRTISLAAGTLPEFDSVTVVEAAAAAGFDACGIWFDYGTWTDDTTSDTRRAFDRAGIRPLEIEVLVLGDPERRAQQGRLLEAGAVIGATDAIVVSAEPDVGRTAELMASLNEEARGFGIRLCLEYLPIFAIGTLAAARDVLARVGDDNVKILVDPLHLARSATSLEDLAEVPGTDFSFAQFCDATAAPPGDGGFDALYDEAVNGRLLPGEGALPLNELLEILPADLPLSLEMRARWLREQCPDPAERAGVVIDSMRRWLAGHNL
jgi:sugar phosphate isomerase/epimerase